MARGSVHPGSNFFLSLSLSPLTFPKCLFPFPLRWFVLVVSIRLCRSKECHVVPHGLKRNNKIQSLLWFKLVRSLSLVLTGFMSPDGACGSISSLRCSNSTDIGVFEPEEPLSFSKTEVPFFARREVQWFVLWANASFLIYFVFLYTYFVSIRSYIFFGLAFTLSLSLSLSDFEDTFSKWMRLIQTLSYANSRFFLDERNCFIYQIFEKKQLSLPVINSKSDRDFSSERPSVPFLKDRNRRRRGPPESAGACPRLACPPAARDGSHANSHASLPQQRASRVPVSWNLYSF